MSDSEKGIWNGGETFTNNKYEKLIRESEDYYDTIDSEKETREEADGVNGSFVVSVAEGSSATLLEASLSDTQRNFLANTYGAFIDEMRRGDAIHVWAAGNSAGAQISVSTAWPLLFPELAGFSIVVAAIGEDGTIGARSNRCGVAKEHCLVAPGGAATGGYAYTRMARAGGGYRTASGTSYAAPYVSGVLGLMQQAFGDQLSLPEYTARLLATADKTGIYADEAVYGQGLVDAEAALTPQGDTQIPLPSGGFIAPRDGAIRGGLLPEEMLERLRRERIIILDELNTPFATQLAVKPSRFQSFKLTEWMTRDDNKTSPYSHPTLASFAELFDGAPLSEYWQLVPISLRDNSLNGNQLPQFGFGFTARRTRRRARLERVLLVPHLAVQLANHSLVLARGQIARAGRRERAAAELDRRERDARGSQSRDHLVQHVPRLLGRLRKRRGATWRPACLCR